MLGVFTTLPSDIRRLIYSFYPWRFSTLNKTFLAETNPLVIQHRCSKITGREAACTLRRILECFTVGNGPEMTTAMRRLGIGIQECILYTGVTRFLDIPFVSIREIEEYVLHYTKYEAVNLVRAYKNGNISVMRVEEGRMSPLDAPSIVLAMQRVIDPVLPLPIMIAVLLRRNRDVKWVYQQVDRRVREHLDWLLRDSITLDAIVGYKLASNSLLMDDTGWTSEELSHNHDQFISVFGMRLGRRVDRTLGGTIYQVQGDWIQKDEWMINCTLSLEAVVDYLEICKTSAKKRDISNMNAIRWRRMIVKDIWKYLDDIIEGLCLVLDHKNPDVLCGESYGIPRG